MIYLGKKVELIVDVVADGDVPLEGLQLFLRSAHCRSVRGPDGRMHSLRDLEPKSIWDFRGHRTICESWFREFLLYDSGAYDLFIETELAEDACGSRPKGDLVRYMAGEYRILAGTRLVIGESGVAWSPNPVLSVSEVVVPWATTTSVQARKRVRGAARLSRRQRAS